MVILTSDASDRLTAAYLAQEGMEIVRNIRDTNWLNMSDDPEATWYDGLSECESGCQADYETTGAATSPLVPYVDIDHLKIDDTGDFYNRTSGTDTKFKRKITITFATEYIMKVSVQVFWDQKPTILNPDGLPGVIETEENLYDWY